ncbi:MAG: hypothetical protein Q8N39_10330, partial [Pelolinea sp.]|nr:hypothetical protein [Pelolinea sp.]
MKAVCFGKYWRMSPLVFSLVPRSQAENVPEGPDATRVMQTMIDEGAELIIPTSFGHMEPAFELAKTNPDVIFEHAGGYLVGDNFANFFGKPPE